MQKCYSLRKNSFGLASVAIGCFVLSNQTVAHAEEVDALALPTQGEEESPQALLTEDINSDQPALLVKQETPEALSDAGEQKDVKETPYEKDISTTYKKQNGQLKPSVNISGDQYSESKPREYIFMVDRSRSLDNDQTSYADNMVNAIIDTMGPQDRASIVYGNLNNMVSLAHFFGLNYNNYVEGRFRTDFANDWTKQYFLGTSLTSNKETLRNNLKQVKNFEGSYNGRRWSGTFNNGTVKSLVYISDEGVMTDHGSNIYQSNYLNNGAAYEQALADIVKKFNLDTVIPITMDEYIDKRNPFRENHYQVLGLPNYKQNPTQADVDKVVNRTLKETKITTYKPITVKATVQGDMTQFKSAKVTGPNGFSKTLTLSGDKKSLNTTFTPTADGSYQLVMDYESQPKNGGAKVEAGFYQGSKALKSDSHTISTIKTAVKEVKKVKSFTTTTKNDPTLPKGKQVVERYGRDGYVIEEITTNTTQGFGQTAKSTNNSKTKQTVAMVPKIIRVGSQEYTYKEVKETQSVPFKTIRQNDDTLDKGQEKIVQKGVNGENTLTYKVTLKNGKEEKKELLSTVQTKKPIDQIIKVGTKMTLVKEVKETQSVPFKTIRENDDTLDKGQEKIVQKGVNGVNTLTYQVTTVNGKQTDKKLVSTVETKKPVDQIIKVGTMVTTYKEESKETPIAFKEHVIRDSNVDPKDSRIEVKGVDGVETSYYKVTYKNGKETHRELLNKKITKRPIDQIRLVGTRITEVKTETAKEAVPFKTLYQEDPTLKLGEEKVAQEGVEGEKTLTYEVTYINRAKDHQKLVKETITKKTRGSNH